MYLVLSVGVLGSVGTYTIAASVITAFKLELNAYDVWNLVYGVVFLVAQTSLVFLFPLIALARVGTDQRKIVSELLNLDSEQGNVHISHNIAHSHLVADWTIC